MKLLMLWNYYEPYLRYFYHAVPDAATLSYREQQSTLFDDHFGWPAELAHYLRNAGVETEFVVGNAVSLQRRWAEENGLGHGRAGDSLTTIVLEQIRRFRPDVLWMPLISSCLGDFLEEARKSVRRIFLWCNIPVAPDFDMTGFDALLTSTPELYERLVRAPRRMMPMLPAFDSRILDKIGAVEARRPVTFIGSLSTAHIRRAEWLAYLLEQGVAVELYGIFRRSAFSETALSQRNVENLAAAHRGEVFGMAMYRRLAESRLSINISIDAPGAILPPNMRLFEATGVGTCLVTDAGRETSPLFDLEDEIAVFATKAQLLERITDLGADPERARRIGLAGQRRTLKEHTFERMTNRMLEILEEAG
jgi:hypothetical protein